MGLAFLILLGASIGWLAAIMREADSQPMILRNCAAGIAGALLAGLLLNPLLDNTSLLSGPYSVEALLVSLIGALVLVASVNLLHRNEAR